MDENEVLNYAEYGWRFSYYAAKHERRYCADCSLVMASDPRPGQSPYRPAAGKSAYQDGAWWYVAVKLEHAYSTCVLLPTLASDQLAALILSARENQEGGKKRHDEVDRRFYESKVKRSWPDCLPLGAPSKLYTSAFLNKTESKSLVKDISCSGSQAAAACVTLNDEQLKRLSEGTGACLVTQWANPRPPEDNEDHETRFPETVLRFPAHVDMQRRVVLVTGCQLSE